MWYNLNGKLILSFRFSGFLLIEKCYTFYFFIQYSIETREIQKYKASIQMYINLFLLKRFSRFLNDSLYELLLLEIKHLDDLR